MPRKKSDIEVLETCSECGNRVDDTLCWCGIDRENHRFVYDHNFVPNGCLCGFHNKPILPRSFFITTIDMRPLGNNYHPKYIDWIRCKYQEENPLVFNPRTWLWLPTYKEAEDFVINNKTDLAEGGTNKWVVIEGIRPICIETRPNPQVFFEFIEDSENDGHYEKIAGWPKPILDYYEKNYLVKQVATIG